MTPQPTTATVLVDGELITGAVYHVRPNGWPCVETPTGRVASGPATGNAGWDRVPDTRDTRYSFMYDDLQGATSLAPGLSLSDWRQLDNAARKAAKR